MRAFSLIRSQPWYRREAFAAGLKAAGHEVQHREPDRYDRDTLLVIWNRYGQTHELAKHVEAGGGRVLVAENGYLGAGGSAPKFDVHPGGPRPHHYYSLSEGWHNGRGAWRAGGAERFAALGVELKPWRTSGGHILVCPNRSFGVPPQVMPEGWAEACAARLRKQTDRPVRVRNHPGNDQPQRPLALDLEGAWAVFIWSSGAGVHALAEGVPTFCEAPYWILKNAAASGSVEQAIITEREPAFQRMAWAQWTLREIETGEPFRCLLSAT